MSSYQNGDRVIVTSGAVKGVPGKILAQSSRTSLLVVELDGGEVVHVMPYEVKLENLPVVDAPAKAREMWGNLQQDLPRAVIADLRESLEVYAKENEGWMSEKGMIIHFIDWLEARGKK